MIRTPKKRYIYSNYDLFEDFSEDAKEYLMENGNNNPSIDDIWEEIYNQDEIYWNDTKEELESFFNGSKWMLQGYNERWNGRYLAGTVFGDFNKMLCDALKDCDYWEMYDENGHFYLKCSHHDGTNLYEVKKITDKGIDYLERWEDNWNDKRTEEYVHSMIMRKYSTLPHYAHYVYGVQKVEYKEN